MPPAGQAPKPKTARDANGQGRSPVDCPCVSPREFHSARRFYRVVARLYRQQNLCSNSRYPFYLANRPAQPNTDLVVTDKFRPAAARVALADAAVIERATAAAERRTVLAHALRDGGHDRNPQPGHPHPAAPPSCQP
jgi:hypothetical protein